MQAHQYKIRLREARKERRAIMQTLDGCSVRQITRAEAESIILRYEWRQSMPAAPRAFYGLFTPQGEIAGAVVFGAGSGTHAANICGPDYRKRVVVLERGACAHWAHKHAASFLIARACKLAARDYGWRIFIAYADKSAGEIRTIYQACNWFYLGASNGRKSAKGRWHYRHKTGETISDREARRRFGTVKALDGDCDWRPVFVPDRGRYVYFEGTRRDRRELRAVLRYAPQPYPKREAEAAPTALQAHGGARRGAAFKVGNPTLKKRGRDYDLARLARDRPDLAARVRAGELSAHAGMIEAGFRRRRIPAASSSFARFPGFRSHVSETCRITLEELVPEGLSPALLKVWLSPADGGVRVAGYGLSLGGN